MKKEIIIYIIIVILLAVIIDLFMYTYHDITSPSLESDVNITDISKEEYIFKDELLSLGYNINDITYIEENFNENDVKKYLLEKKYDNLSNFAASPYFKIDNINRYQEYFNNYGYTADKSVLYVEIGLDVPFYENIESADTTKNEMILVNKYFSLDENYEANLVDIDKKLGGGKMNSTAYQYFESMCADALLDGITLKSVSAYRSYKTQKKIYNSYVKKDGKKKADTYSARPGHSEHQTGLAVDINTSSTSKHFENTKEYSWLINNAYKYGFILRYPKDKEFITGYQFEPWHYRFVGTKVSTKIYEENLTFEEYLAKHES